MDCYICKTCGVQYSPTERPPEHCVICEDERQYIGHDGQQWTTMGELQAAGHRNEIREHEPGLVGVCTEPRVGIGQRALLVQTPAGNLLWDAITYLDDETVRRLNELGGVQAISSSHPHFYGAMVEWARAFGATVWVPEADRQWVTYSDPVVRYWRASEEVLPGVTLVQTGGHFPGSAVVHWAAGADGRGALLTGDSISVVQDRRWLTFMWSYPNTIPLSELEVRGIAAAVEPYEFERIYGGWWASICQSDAKAAVRRSAERYIRHITSNK